MGTDRHHFPKGIIWSAITLLLTAHMSAVAARNPVVHAACHEDAKRLCADVLGNREAVRACMRAHHEQLSDKCKATIVEVKHGRNSGSSFAQGSCEQVCAEGCGGKGVFCFDKCTMRCAQVGHTRLPHY
jgi:hypothetical protein